MNEGRQITKEQAEACMRADADFAMKGNGMGSYIFDGKNTLYKSDSGGSRYTFCNSGFEHDGWSVEPTIHADPNNTFERLFGTERELTFEEVGAALFRGATILCLAVDGGEYLLRLRESNRLFIEWKFRGQSKWVDDNPWAYQRASKFFIHKEPTPEPLTLEALEARVKALEERS